MFYIFHFLQSDMVFGIVNPFSWKTNAISFVSSCLMSMPFLLTHIDVRTLNFIPLAESWLVNSNFLRASGMQGSAFPPRGTTAFSLGESEIKFLIKLQNFQF